MGAMGHGGLACLVPGTRRMGRDCFGSKDMGP